jgi:hypothetical protein
MIRTRFRKVIIVAPAIFPDQLVDDYTSVKHIQAVNCIFPALFELNPNLIIFDYDYIGSDIEKILRRIKVNKFYSKLKICCYKSTRDEEADGLLKALGVDQLFYRDDFNKQQKEQTARGNFNPIDAAILKWVPSISN